MGQATRLPQQNNAPGSALLFNMEKTAKEALDLIYFKGHSFAEAAATLNIPLSNLKEKIKTAINHLRGLAIS